ncbi:MAG: IS30 family transposase [Muribaculaceae bacterium]|nr:IS30 family transposase [Muribaculaceae bacterium]
MYHQLTSEQRSQISALLQNKTSRKEIAEIVGISQSTLSRELKRNSSRNGRHYSWRKAHEMALERRERICRNRMIPQSVMKKAIKILTDWQWSPEQISAHLKAEGEKISHETIYAYIRLHPELHVHCKHRMKYRHHIKRRKVTKAINIPNRVSIHERPPEANGSRFGDWELDLIVGSGQKSCLVTLVERSRSYVLIKRLETKHHTAVKQAIIQMLFPFRKTPALKTITTDNGIEFHDHQDFAKALCTTVYFADAYASWQKGAVENANKLIRQYFPKGTDFRNVSDNEVLQVQRKLNQRPRAKINFSSPLKEFYAMIS